MEKNPGFCYPSVTADSGYESEEGYARSEAIYKAPDLWEVEKTQFQTGSYFFSIKETA